MEHSHDSVRRGARGASVTVAFPGGARVSVEVTDEVADALRDMQREAWRIERREDSDSVRFSSSLMSWAPEWEGRDRLQCRSRPSLRFGDSFYAQGAHAIRLENKNLIYWVFFQRPPE
ncbi:hypothetical protein H7U33_06920 [Collinsella intestinalis]|nr:hypothetical protein [Collinsella intestinalis]